MPEMLQVPGVLQGSPVVHHVMNGYTFENLNEEGHSIRRCTCGESFEFFGKYNEGQDATLLGLVQHIYVANADYHAEND